MIQLMWNLVLVNEKIFCHIPFLLCTNVCTKLVTWALNDDYPSSRYQRPNTKNTKTLSCLEKLGKWEYIFQSGKSQGILNIQEKSGEFYQKWKSEGILGSFYLYLFCDLLIEVYLLNSLNSTT